MGLFRTERVIYVSSFVNMCKIDLGTLNNFQLQQC